MEKRHNLMPMSIKEGNIIKIYTHEKAEKPLHVLKAVEFKGCAKCCFVLACEGDSELPCNEEIMFEEYEEEHDDKRNG
jgi:hypothetical protein